MRLSHLSASLLLSLLPLTLSQNVNIPTYFVINSPTKGTIWTNNATNLVQWVHAVNDVPTGVFDLELARLSTDGLLEVALNVQANWGGLNIDLIDVPLGDDYFMMFVDVTNGVSYSTSQRFAIANTNGTTPSTDSTKPTASISGAPNPTANFYTTFAPGSASSAVRLLGIPTAQALWAAGFAAVGMGIGALAVL